MTAGSTAVGRVLHRAPSLRASSFALEELDVAGPDGSIVRLVHKDCSPERMLAQASRVRPRFLFDPAREATMYREVLDPDRHGTPRCHAVRPPAAAPVLVLERVDGAPLEEVAFGDPWRSAARWLGRFHAGFTTDAAPGAALSGAPWLVSYDRDYFSRWPARAVRNLRACDRRGAGDVAALARRYEAVLDVLETQPRSLVHGDFHPANVLVADGGRRICVLDWELAGWGPSLLDLAALTSGSWPEDRRRALEHSYRTGSSRPVWDDTLRFEQALECCRLHLAVQWLGWASRWTPESRRHGDWVAVAKHCADRLGM